MIDVSKVERLMALMAQYGVDVVEAASQGESIALAKNASAHSFFTGGMPASLQGGARLGDGLSRGMGAGSNAGAGIGSYGGSDTGGANAGSSNHEGATGDVVRIGAGTAGGAAKETKNAPAAPAELPAGETITSPFVGTFYRTPSPDSPAFVEVGARVRKGQTLCIVEAMKLMNEIESEVDGTVVAILMENAKPVEFGTALFIIAP